jgi:hypothetical protein
MAPSLATLRKVMTVVRLMPDRAAASTVDHSPVKVLSQISSALANDRSENASGAGAVWWLESVPTWA